MNQGSTAPVPPPRRGRPPGRSVRQEEQRKLNRSAIVGAAARVFAAKPYYHATIDDIIAAAGISRATFYVHFESKLALALEIYESITASWLEHFDLLATLPALEIDALKRWTLGLAELYIGHGYITPLVDQLALFEQPFRQRFAQDRAGLIDRLAGAGFPGCIAAAGTTREAHLQRARLHLLLQRLDRVCSVLAHSGECSAQDADAYSEAMAEELRERLGWGCLTRPLGQTSSMDNMPWRAEG